MSSHNKYGSRLSSPSSIAVLTARAREFKFALALKPGDKVCSAYTKTGLSNGVPNWGVEDVYYGSVAEWVFQNKKGDRKVKNFEIMMRNDMAKGRRGEYVLIGDTGEKDEDAGEKLARKFPNEIKAVFLHAVTSSSDRSSLRIPPDRTINGVPFYYFRTYVGAAKKAFQAGLLGGGGLLRVVDQARKDLSSKDLPKPNMSPKERAKLSTRWAELEEDIAELEPTQIIQTQAKVEQLFSMLDMMAGR